MIKAIKTDSPNDLGGLYKRLPTCTTGADRMNTNQSLLDCTAFTKYLVTNAKKWNQEMREFDLNQEVKKWVEMAMVRAKKNKTTVVDEIFL